MIYRQILRTNIKRNVWESLVRVNVLILVVTLLGCGGRLEVKGGGDDDDDDDGRHKKDDVCKSKNWSPPLINFPKKSDPKMKFCRVNPKETERCNMQTARYLTGYERWKNLTNIQQKFYGSKKGKDILLKVILPFKEIFCAAFVYK